MMPFNNHVVRPTKTTSNRWVCLFQEHWNNDYSYGGINEGVTPSFESRMDSILYAMKEINKWIEHEFDGDIKRYNRLFSP